MRLEVEHRFARRALAWVARLVPDGSRADWRREWEAELWHWLERERQEATSASGVRMELMRRLAGAIRHAMWARRSEPRGGVIRSEFVQAIRVVYRRPGFSLLIAGLLSLGIGANTAMFTIVSSVLIRPLPYPEPQELVYLYGSFQGYDQASISPPDFLDYRERNTVFDAFAARTIGSSAVLTDGAEPERVESVAITANFFETLGVTPLMGRAFLPEEEIGEGHDVVILSHALWRRRFGGDPGVIGQTTRIDGRAIEVVGVMPPLLDRTLAVDLWRPLAFHTPETSVRRFHFLRGMARLKRGTTLEQAQAGTDVIARQLEDVYPENATWRLRLLPYRDVVVGNVGPMLLVLLGAVSVVVLITCGNIASLLLARATTRAGEIAVRAALGASRRRLVGQLLIESILLGITGGVAGLALAAVLVKATRVLAAGFLPRLGEVAMDGTVLGFTLAVSVATGIIFGLAPALHAVRSSLSSGLVSMGRAGRSRRGLRMRDTLVVAQVAFSFVLLVGAGLLGRTLWRLSDVNPGFDAEGVVTAAIQIPPERYALRDQQNRVWNDLLDRIRALPGVVQASATTMLPLAGGGDTYYWLEREPPATEADRRNALISVVADDFFATLRIPIVEGRGFGPDEQHAPNGIVLNQSMAARLFPFGAALGERLVVDFGAPFAAEIVGIAGDVLAFGLENDPPDIIYLAHAQAGGFGRRFLNLVVRTPSDPLALVPALRTELAQVDRDIPLANPRSMESVVGSTIASERFSARLLASFAALALGLATIGLYGVLACNVAQRAPEMGVRLALGARRGQVFGLMLARGLVIVVLGLVLGGAAALPATRLVEGLLFNISTRDPLVFGAVPLVLTLAGLLACALPALRATRVDPAKVLKAN